MMDNFRKLLDESSCEDNHGCHPTTCVCALAGDMVDEIERLKTALGYHVGELQEARRQAIHDADNIQRLRAALRQIAALDQDIVPASDRLGIARSLARMALTDDKENT